ncbi:UNVERIFIED_CONTAM: Ferritin-2, chloroplastic [Sesamum latifolium]|uniref:Ferritin n=1 Tax=Sesamum latifolium TaxID=2727402 RepID=A0AAW2XF77_9LAMI
MLLKSAPALGLLNSHGENLSPLFSSVSSSSFKSFVGRKGNGCVACVAKHTNSKPLTGVVFEPFEEVKKELMLVPTVPQDSLARQKYSDGCEVALNEQINVEYNVSYVYHAMFAYFDRDNVALKGLAKMGDIQFFNKTQNKRGGKVKLQSIYLAPVGV